jgi:hypothetical protein
MARECRRTSCCSRRPVSRSFSFGLYRARLSSGVNQRKPPPSLATSTFSRNRVFRPRQKAFVAVTSSLSSKHPGCRCRRHASIKSSTKTTYSGLGGMPWVNATTEAIKAPLLPRALILWAKYYGTNNPSSSEPARAHWRCFIAFPVYFVGHLGPDRPSTYPRDPSLWRGETKRKRLQVFVSSAYTDMLLERQAAVESILKAGHIPAGMELFTAGDQTQLQVIRR